MGGGDAEGPIVVRDDFQAERQVERRPTQQLVAGKPGAEIVVGGADLGVEPGGRAEETEAFGGTRLDAGLDALGPGLGDVVGLEAGGVVIDEVGQLVAEGDQRPRQGARHGVLMTQADLGAGIALGTERQPEMRAVGEVVGGGRAIGRADPGMREQLLGQTARIAELTGGLAGEIREVVLAHRGAEPVGGGDLPVGPGPDAEALVRVRPGQAARGDIELFERRPLVGESESQRQVRADLAVDEGRELVASQQIAVGVRSGDARDRAAGAGPEDGGLGGRIQVAQAGRQQPAAVALPVRQAAGAADILAGQAGLAVVGRTDEVEDQVGRKFPLVPEVGAQGVAPAVRTPAIVLRGREADRGTVRRRPRAGGVVRQKRQTEGTTTVGTAFGDERRAGLGRERRLLAEVDDAAKGVGAVERGRRPAEDLDGREPEDAVAADLVGIGKSLGEPTAVKQHGGLGRIRATQEERAHRTFAGLLGGVDPRSAAEQAGQGRLPGFRRGGDVQAADRRRGVGQRGGLPSFDHDRFGQPGGRLGQEDRKEREHSRTIGGASPCST